MSARDRARRYRATDSPRKGRMWVAARWAYRVWQNVVPLVALYALFIVLSDSQQRRDQACLLFERQEEAAVNRLIGTYRYLDTLPPEERGTNLTKTIVAQLPATEAEARAVRAPAYCNEPDTGLDEKDVPEIPARRSYGHLLKPADQ